MSEATAKWQVVGEMLTPAGTVNIEAEDGTEVAYAEKAYAASIVRDHNAHDALVEALEGLMDSLAWHGEGANNLAKRRSREQRVDAAYDAGVVALEAVGSRNGEAKG